MFRKFTITDTEDKEIVFKVYPEENNKVVFEKDEIPLKLETRLSLLRNITSISQFMDGNTVFKLEVEEEE